MKIRTITSVVAGAFYLTFLLIGSLPFALLITLIAVIGYMEIGSMKKPKPIAPSLLLGAGAVAFVVLTPAFSSKAAPDDLFLICLLILTLLLLAMTVVSVNRFSFDQAAHLLIAFIYIGFSFSLLVRLRFDSLAMILLVQIIIWSTDTGAYLIGRKWGRHKLAPHISPNKTWEGFAGGTAAALCVATIFQLFWPEPIFPTTMRFEAVVLLVTLVGQFGDLIESAMKRSFNVKDSGRILPGHGGMFDRFDSLIFVLPVLYLIGLIG